MLIITTARVAEDLCGRFIRDLVHCLPFHRHPLHTG